MELLKDDIELTLKELKNQRTQLAIQLGVVECGIKGFEVKLSRCKR